MNPLLSPWTNPHGLPPFQDIKLAHYLPAFIEAFRQQQTEIHAIETNSEPPNFANTIEALDISGHLLRRVSSVFFMLTSAHSSEAMRAIQSEITPLNAAHESEIYTRTTLFKRVDRVANLSRVNLDEEQQQLLTETHKRFIRAGAKLNKADKAEILNIDAQLATQQTRFGQNVLNSSNQFELLLENETELQGLPLSIRSNAKREADARGHKDKYLFTLSRSSVTPFLQFSARRELREVMWRAYTNCANNDDALDNKAVIANIVGLRAQRAQLLGFASHADYILDANMAQSPTKVRALLDQIWQPAKERAKQEVADLQTRIQRDGKNDDLAPWDWWYFTEKIRAERFDLDSEALKPYFQIDKVRQGAFEVARQLFGLQFTALDPLERPALYHEDVEAFEVREADGRFIGLFLTDYYMRPSKRGGAWMNSLQKQSSCDGEVYPIVCNTCNFAKGAPSLLGLDEVRTLFHEFGHALHGLLSKVKYQSLSGTAVKRDFVELPSQIMEHWATEAKVLKHFARHYETEEIIPDELIAKIQESSTFNQGFATTEYLAASYLDLAWHGPTLTQTTAETVTAAEQAAMEDLGLIPEVAPRYRSTYFQHIFSGGYSAGYYAYIWAEVLDADAYEAFKVNGIFDARTAQAFRTHILEKGGSVEPMVLYQRFRGKEPTVTALLQGRGLT